MVRPLFWQAGQAISFEGRRESTVQHAGEEGAEYISVCTPAFSPDTVHRQA